MKRIEKLERNYIKKMVEEILEIEAEALEYTANDFDNSYAVEKFAERISEEISFYIDKMIERNVNANIIERLKDFNFALWNRNVHLTRFYQGW